ncbi:DUF2795 domain-containing protein [Geodermatophilus chilensis]|uniref:DUF2795 domain-containing protein n=1 Tax=Geodermatophilus chilensis TaxID=2035835 RepID=UPI0018E44D14|nr:DUF2795 domain-containing protein [Geodermatophilus chilensis]
MADAVTADDVMRHLTDVDYPADKETLLAEAERRGASPEVVKAIRAVPPVDYRNRDEVVRSLRLDPAPHAEPGQQARASAPPGVSQVSRTPQQDRVAGEDRRTT